MDAVKKIRDFAEHFCGYPRKRLGLSLKYFMDIHPWEVLHTEMGF
jgi:hypothetical protein